MGVSCAAPKAGRRKRLSGASARRSRSRDPQGSGVGSSEKLGGRGEAAWRCQEADDASRPLSTLRPFRPANVGIQRRALARPLE